MITYVAIVTFRFPRHLTKKSSGQKLSRWLDKQRITPYIEARLWLAAFGLVASSMR